MTIDPVVATIAAVVVFILGLLIGSFLNVVIYRVPNGLSIVSPPSACPSCGHSIRARDNVPVLSWLLLRGKCRDCGARISARYPLVELVTALLFLVVFAVLLASGTPGAMWALPAFLYLASISVALAGIDLDTRKLPNSIVLPSYLIGAVLLVVASAGTGDWGALVPAVIGAVALFGFYFLLVLVYPSGMGFGDVKLAGVLGMYLGWLGWGPLLVGAFAAFLLGGFFAVGLIVTRKAGRKSAIPFGPWMLVGAWAGIFFGQVIATAYLALFGLNMGEI